MGNCQTQSPSRKDPVFFNQAAAGENATQPTGDAIPPEQVASTSDEEVLKTSVQENKPSDTKENEAAETGLHHNLAGKLIKASEVSRLIDEQLIKDYRANERIVKLLLLGPSESGKSTVLKQMKLTHCHGFSETELMARRSLIFLNVVQSMTQLVYGLRRLGYKLPIEFEADASLIVQTLQSSKDLEHSLPENVYRAVKKLWAEPKIQEAYERRSEFHLIDCAKYFLDNLDRLNENAYCPTVDDVLRARMETVGVAQIHYSYKDLDFRIFDVGGQKNERRKWIHLFDNVNALFFLAAISEYDQKMREDSETNRLHDAIELFSGIGNNSLFSKVQIILFLNKQDLFAEKILKIPLTACFPSYRYKNDFKNASLYITRKFEKQIKDQTKMIYTHLTTATDTSQLTFLMNSIIDFIIAENFKQTGVL